MSVRILEGDALTVLRGLDAGSVQTCVTSPPYFGLRDYGVLGQLGLEKTPQLYVDAMVHVFSEVKRVLRDDGTLWLNVGDSYSNAGTRQGDRDCAIVDLPHAHRMVGSGYRARIEGLKNKDLIGVPWLLAFALRADGWYLRSDIIWHKPNPMPESVTDRPTKSHEYLFLLTKSERYYYDADAIAEETGGRELFGNSRKLTHDDRNDCSRRDMAPNWTRNKRSVWTVTTLPYTEAHFATFPPKLIEPCILAGSAKGQTVLDPFGGAGTTGLVADRLGRNAILIELNSKYAEMARKRIADDAGMFGEVT